MPRLSDEFIAEALKWLGTPWIDGGRSERGIDCLGLIILSAQAAGVPIKDRADVKSLAGMQELIKTAQACCDEIPVREIRKGAILLAHVLGERSAKHIMIYDGYAVIHCGMHWNKVVRHRLDEKMRESVKRAWVFKKEYECLEA